MAGLAMIGADFGRSFAAPAVFSPPAPREPREPGEPRERVRTTRGRAVGKRKDPFFGIKSKGRNGAWRRARDEAEAFAKTYVGKRNARGRGLGWISATRKRVA